MRNFYKLHHLSFVKPSYSLHNNWSKEAIRAVRMEFVVKLCRSYINQQQVIFMDETTFNFWHKKSRMWMSREEPLSLKMAGTRGSGITVLGAISSQSSQLVYSMDESTNIGAVIKLIKKMARVYTDLHEAVLVLDNHNSHYNEDVQMLAMELGLELLYLPVYSSQLNPIESVWGVMKFHWANVVAEARLRGTLEDQLTQTIEDFVQG